jgi:hypothetical protein
MSQCGTLTLRGHAHVGCVVLLTTGPGVQPVAIDLLQETAVDEYAEFQPGLTQKKYAAGSPPGTEPLWPATRGRSCMLDGRPSSGLGLIIWPVTLYSPLIRCFNMVPTPSLAFAA